MQQGFECVIIGAEGSGKTFLLRQLWGLFQHGLTSAVNDTTAPTVGQDIITITTNKKNEIRIREVGGSMWAGWSSYLSDCNSFIYVIDVSDPGSAAIAFVQIHEICFLENLKEKKKLFLLNKRDLVDAGNFDICVNLLRLDELVQLGYFERPKILVGSAYNSSYIRSVYGWIIDNHTI